jgi:hypothetical protein
MLFSYYVDISENDLTYTIFFFITYPSSQNI